MKSDMKPFRFFDKEYSCETINGMKKVELKALLADVKYSYESNESWIKKLELEASDPHTMKSKIGYGAMCKRFILELEKVIEGMTPTFEEAFYMASKTYLDSDEIEDITENAKLLMTVVSK